MADGTEACEPMEWMGNLTMRTVVGAAEGKVKRYEGGEMDGMDSALRLHLPVRLA